MILEKDYFPQRIVCLTEEPTEILYLLGQEDRIVGVSGFTMRPLRARNEKPKISAFTTANIEEIVALNPDLVIGFSDIQADIARELIARGINVWINNHRSVSQIYNLIVQLGSMVGQMDAAERLVREIQGQINQISRANLQQAHKPKIYFEEWYDPLITGIQWVGEIIELAGGQDIFPEHRNASLAKDRILADGSEVVKRNPDIILASWCGKKFKKDKLVSRPNWNQITAVQQNHIYEIDSEIILQPGPAALTDGIAEITQIIADWHVQQHSDFQSSFNE
ncbi:MAG: cobalamin-binding protein [Weeksellaceae bacterium]|nr:cobalamin-binding protein [Weeksellaceae bacterium]